jgi:Carboxypeptidase regulatory-like domain
MLKNNRQVESRLGSHRLASLFTLALAVAVVLITGPRLMAQSDTGRVEGTVTDNTDAVIPGATITLTNTDTSQARTATTDGAGSFTFNALERGHYSAVVKANGFQSETQLITLEVSQVQALNFKLNPGTAATTVTVTGAAPIVNTTNAMTGAVIQGRQITELPLNGRNFTQLALLVPGVTRGAYGSDASGANGNSETYRYSETGGASLSVNGIRAQANNFELDGVDNNDGLVNTIVFFPPVEATQEFRVSTSVAPAEFGRAGGAIVQSSIKSGTNHIHGSAFFFDRDQIFDASPNYFSPPGTPTPSFHRTQFGGTLGGPIWRNHIFLFGDYQGLRLKQPNGSSFQTVPTMLMRTGDFSELENPALTGGTDLTTLPYASLTGCTYPTGYVKPFGAIYDPTTCQPFQNNQIPASRANTAALNYFNAFPMPNVQGTVTNNYFTNPAQIERFDDFDVRLDANISSKDTVFARYSYGQDNLTKGSLFPALPAGFGSGINPTHPRGVAAGYTHIFSANVINEFRYGYLRPYYAYINPFENIPISQNLGIQNANRNALLGGGALIGGSNYEIAYTGDGGPYTVPQKSNQFVDEVSLTKGAHTMKFGANIEKREVDFFQGNNAKGQFQIGGNTYPGTGRLTGYEASELVAGFTDYLIGVAENYFDTVNWETGYFAEDDWKVSPRLSLNFGLRYDLYTHPYETHNNQSNYSLATGTLLVAGQNGNSRSLIDTNFKNFAPRLSFAYDLTGQGKTVLRGGYGLFYFLDRGGVGNQLSNNPDFNGAADYQATQGYRITFTGQGPLNDNNNLDATNPLPLPVFGSTVDRNDPQNASLIAVDKRLPTSMIQEWNLQVERQLDANTSINIAYVGTKADHLMTWFNTEQQILNAPASTYLYPDRASDTINRGVAEGASNYNGLQLFLNRRMAHGLQLTAAYTWSHTLDNSNGAFNTGTAGAGTRFFMFASGPSFRENYGNSDQDQPNVFVFSALAELPFGRGKRFASNIPLALDEAIGGWQLNTIVSLESGTPFDVSTSKGTAPDGSIISANPNNRADQTAPVHYVKSLHEWFDTSTFVNPPANSDGVFVRPGNIDRNQVFGPGHSDMDLSLFKDFPIYESVVAQFRAEAFNITNTPAFDNPNGNLDSGAGSLTGADTGAFGQINGTHTHSERQLELAFRIQF